MTVRQNKLYINGRFLAQPLSGVQRYAREIVSAIDDLAGKGQFGGEVIVAAPPGTPFPQYAAIQTRHIGPLRGHAWSQATFPLFARRGIALNLTMNGSALHRRQISVIHDMAVFRHPENYSYRYALAHRVITRLTARVATLGTVSEFSRREIASILGMPTDDIFVAENSADHVAEPDPTIVPRLGLSGRPYFVTLGSLTPNKNIQTALKAIDRIDNGEARLVVVGSFDSSVFRNVGLSAGTRTVFTGRLTDAEISGLLQQSNALVFPSIYEGFGIPPLEAMRVGCPVIASKAEAVLEVCEDAAEYFSATDDLELANLLNASLIGQSARRAEQIRRGHERVAAYSWERSARKILAVCEAMPVGASKGIARAE